MTSTSPGPSTAHAISPDSGTHWTEPGAWTVAPGVHRIPLPLPMDGLRAVNVYVLETDDGLTLIDGGWAIDVSRTQLEQSLKDAFRSDPIETSLMGWTPLGLFELSRKRERWPTARLLGDE